MLNFSHRQGKIFSSVAIFAVTFTTLLTSPARGESIVINQEQSQYSSQKIDYNFNELVDLLNSENIKFSLLNHTYDFSSSFLDAETKVTNFKQANDYKIDNLKISEFEQSGNLDSALAQ